MFSTTQLRSCFSDIDPALATVHACPYTARARWPSALESKHCCTSAQHATPVQGIANLGAGAMGIREKESPPLGFGFVYIWYVQLPFHPMR